VEAAYILVPTDSAHVIFILVTKINRPQAAPRRTIARLVAVNRVWVAGMTIAIGGKGLGVFEIGFLELIALPKRIGLVGAKSGRVGSCADVDLSIW
jgi:hypothetical protein